MFTDSHCHLYKEYYDDIDSILKLAKKNFVDRYINNGCDKNTNIEVLNLINKHENMYGTLGIHPEYVNKYNSLDIKFIEKNLNTKKIVAIGEIGLDYYYTKDNKIEQLKLFETQLKIAEDNDMPVVVHSREATLDTINTLKKYNVNGLIHSFSGSLETAKEYIKLGFLIGVNGIVTFKNAKIKDVIKEIPLENLVLETDSPYLTPSPYRGKQNNPSHILDIAKFVAELKNITLEQLSEVTNKNLKKIFKI